MPLRNLRNLATVHEQLKDTSPGWRLHYKKQISLVDSMFNYNSANFYTKTNYYTNFLINNNKIPEARVQAMQLFWLGQQINNNDRN